jgi:predicted transcriptional regulator
LNRLYKKGFLTGRKEKRAYLYAPKYSLEEIKGGLAGDIIDCLFGFLTEGAEPMLECLVETVSERDRALLDEITAGQ